MAKQKEVWAQTLLCEFGPVWSEYRKLGDVGDFEWEDDKPWGYSEEPAEHIVQELQWLGSGITQMQSAHPTQVTRN